MKQLYQDTREVVQLPSPDVRCLPDAIIIDRMTVRDPMVVDYYTAMAVDRRPLIAQDAFTIGTRALAAAGGSATMAALNDHLESAVRNAAQALTTLPAVINEQIGAVCQRYLGENGEFVEHLGKDLQSVGAILQPDGKIVTDMRDTIVAENRRRITDALAPLAQALNVNDADGPMGLVHRALQHVITGQAELRELVHSTVRLQAQRDLSIQKGYDLEEFINVCLGQLTGQLGDELENCSCTAGIVPGSKEGDFVCVIDPRLTRGRDARIGLEAKNRKSDTVMGLCRLLDSVKENRGTLVAIGVLTNPKVVTRPIALYGADKIIVHLPGFGSEADLEHQRLLLETAYYIARLMAAACINAVPTEFLDVSFMNDHLDRLDGALGQFKTLARNLTAIELAVRKTRECGDSVRDCLKDIAAELRLALAQYTERLVRETSHDLADCNTKSITDQTSGGHCT